MPAVCAACRSRIDCSCTSKNSMTGTGCARPAGVRCCGEGPDCSRERPRSRESTGPALSESERCRSGESNGPPAARNTRGNLRPRQRRNIARACAIVVAFSRKWRCSDLAKNTQGYFRCTAQRDDRRRQLLDRDAGRNTAGASGAFSQRQAQLERHLAGAQHRELRHPVAQRQSGVGLPPWSGRAGARGGCGGVRRRWRGSRAASASSKATRSRTCRRRRRSNWRTRRTGSIAIRRSSAICPACRAPTTCRSRFRSCRATRRSSSAYEYAGAVRNIYLTDPGPAPVDSWMGQSVGKWDGDTLVITVTGLNDQSGSIAPATITAIR